MCVFKELEFFSVVIEKILDIKDSGIDLQFRKVGGHRVGGLERIDCRWRGKLSEK